MTYWRIDWHFLDNDKGTETIPMMLCDTIDKAIENYLTLINSEGTGWYDLVEINEKVISL